MRIVLVLALLSILGCDSESILLDPSPSFITGTVTDSVSLDHLPGVVITFDPIGAMPTELGETDSLGHYDLFFYRGTLAPKGSVIYELPGYNTREVDAATMPETLGVFFQNVLLTPE